MNFFSLATLLAALFAMTPLSAQNAAQMTEDEAEAIAMDAYIYGYPLVTMDMTCRVMTNVTRPEKMKAPMGQFSHAQTFPTAVLK
ncbi:MAG TPA: hypothetical protein VN457_05135, partial [Chlamydiales bacterium]|nr:hypothetical protein [Chlamydiales bacterium]